MKITRAKAVTAMTLAALGGLSAAALASNAADTKPLAAPAPTTPIVEQRTVVVHRTIHRTKTISAAQAAAGQARHAKAKAKGRHASTSAASPVASAPAPSPAVEVPNTSNLPAAAPQRSAAAPRPSASGEPGDDDRGAREPGDDQGSEGTGDDDSTQTSAVGDRAGEHASERNDD